MPATSYTSLPIVGAASAASSASSVSSHTSDHLTLAVLGCGTMGIAILSGILASLAEMDAPRPLQVVATHPHHPATSGSSGSSTPGAPGDDDEMPAQIPTRFLACVRRPESAKRVKAALWEHSSIVKVVVGDNVVAVQQAGVVLLACPAAEARALLCAPGMARALHGKLLISICAGVTVGQIEGWLHGGAVPTLDPDVDGRCRVVRVRPNAAGLIGESMTVVDTATTTPTSSALVTWIFRRIGDVAHLPGAGDYDDRHDRHDHHDYGNGSNHGHGASSPSSSSSAAATALSTAGPAFFALVLEAAVDGAVALGLPRSEALRMAAQSMRGAAGLVLQNGEHPALLRDRISTPGGCAAHGLLALEEGRVRNAVAHAVREAAAVARQEGHGGF